MNEAFYRQTARVEDVHWWFEHRRRLVRALLARLAPLPAGPLLDLGCGSGGNLELLATRDRVAIGLDQSALALALAREKRPRALLVRGDAQQVQRLFRRERFAAVTVFNVLYHRAVRDDAAVLAGIAEVLRPGGALVLTEPAHRFLARRHDVVDHGARRYGRHELLSKVERAGLAIERATRFNALGFLPALAVAAIDRLGGRLAAAPRTGEGVGEVALPPAALNRALVACGAAERAWIGRVGALPFGVGLLVVARKR